VERKERKYETDPAKIEVDVVTGRRLITPKPGYSRAEAFLDYWKDMPEEERQRRRRVMQQIAERLGPGGP
jgi:hypothetical protein